LLAADVISGAHSTILMSGTLTPTAMYTDTLGFPDATRTAELASPFPIENRLALVIPQTTTKFTERTTNQYNRIAAICATIANATPGCSAFYFPSYAIRDAVAPAFETACRRTIFKEAPRMTRDDKHQLLERFKTYKNSGAALLGAATGSFGEGVDMPGVLKSVTVVGLPLDKPDLETKELINYYDTRYGKGWDYGYIFPAITKTLQNAGRCIRTEHDHGALLFLDERFAWPRYLKCFPPDWNIRVAPEYLPIIQRFFDEKNSRTGAAKL
jgi:DNA excision repair protein ERCC-2